LKQGGLPSSILLKLENENPARAGGRLSAMARCDGYLPAGRVLGARRASLVRAMQCQARACSPQGTLSEVIGSIGLSTKVSVKMGG